MKTFSSSSFARREQAFQPAVAIESSGTPGCHRGMMSSGELIMNIVDLSSRPAVKGESACQQPRVAKDNAEVLVQKDEQLRQLAVALKEETAAREKAESCYHALKLDFDNMCQHRSMADTRVMQLNLAFKESLEELKFSKDQLEHKTNEATIGKRECEKLRFELESENRRLKMQLMEVTAESIAISKSLQERGRSLNEITETRAKVEAESRILQVQIESLHKDVDAHKYETHVLKKELQLRNEEKEQNKRIADGAHKRHLENVKKIAKLDAECNRLRALVRKRLPGPVVLAQMRADADNVVKKRMPTPKFSPDQKELDPLTDRLVAIEDETKLLKESLVKRTAELHAARQLCARMASKLASAESIIEAVAKRQVLPSLSGEENIGIPLSFKSESASRQSSVYSPAGLHAGGETMEVMDCALSSEDGNTNDDELSCAESWASALIAELAHFQKKDGNISMKTDSCLEDSSQVCHGTKSSDSSTINNSNEKTETLIESGSERVASCKGAVRRIVETMLAVTHRSLQEGLSSEDEGVLTKLQLLSNAFNAGYECDNLSELVAAELLCKVGHLVKEHCAASSVPANVMNGQNLDRNVQDEGDMPGLSNHLETDNARDNAEPTFVRSSDEDGGATGDIDVNHGSSHIDITAESRIDDETCADSGVSADETCADSGTTNLQADGEDGCNSVIDNKCDERNDEKPDCELALQIQLLRDEVERVSADRDDLAAKLAHCQGQLDQQLARITTVDAESLLLASEKASLAQQLSSAAERNQALEEDLAEARASLDGLRHQVAFVPSEKRSHSLDSEGNVEDAGTVPEKQDQARGEVDQKLLLRQRKEHEVASAKAQLAECQRTILELGKQLRAMSSVDSVLGDPSFDSSLESAASTDQMNSPATRVARGECLYESARVGPRAGGGSRRAYQAGYVRTRGGRLVSAEQYWGGGSGDIPAPAAGGDCQGGPSPFLGPSGRYLMTPRNSYVATCPQSPLYEYVSDHPAYVCSPPETALSSPAASPARFNTQFERALKAPPSGSGTTGGAVPKTTSRPSLGTGSLVFASPPPAPSPSPAKKPSRMARLFTRGKNQR